MHMARNAAAHAMCVRMDKKHAPLRQPPTNDHCLQAALGQLAGKHEASWPCTNHSCVIGLGRVSRGQGGCDAGLPRVLLVALQIVGS